MRSATDVVLCPSDVFLFQVFGPNSTATFSATLTQVDEMDIIKNADFQFVEGGNAQIISVSEMDFDFEILSRIRYSAQIEASRIKVATTSAKIEWDDQSIEVNVSDISLGGIGFLSSIEFKRGQSLTMTIYSEYGVIIVKGEVRYSRPDKKNEEQFRTGVKFEAMERIDQAKWQRLLPMAS